MPDKPKIIEEQFYHIENLHEQDKYDCPSHFKNGYIRSKIHEGILNPTDIYHLGTILAAEYFKPDNRPVNILLASDTRSSGAWIKQQLIAGLSTYKVNIYDADIAPTPLVSVLVEQYKNKQSLLSSIFGESTTPFFDLGIIITASHNAAEYNGIKFAQPFFYFDHDDSDRFSLLFELSKKYDLSEIYDSPNNLDQPPMIHSFDQAEQLYIQHIKKQLLHYPYDQQTIVLDCAHGATYELAPKIFTELGFKVIPFNCSPDGENINNNSGCTRPELLLQAVQYHDADWGCAFDGDGDRVIIANQQHIFDGDDIVSVIMNHPTHQKESTIVGTTMSNQGLQEYVNKQNQQFVRAKVGHINVLNQLDVHKSNLGSETCGHVTVKSHSLSSDGIFAALLFFDTLKAEPSMQLPLFDKHTAISKNIALEGNKAPQPEEIAAIVKIVQAKYHYQGRIVVRPSDTEPVLRVLVEHQNDHIALSMFNEIAQLIKDIC